MAEEENFDEFSQEEFENLGSEKASSDGLKGKALDAWRNKPIVKLLVIMVGVGIALAVVLGSSSKKEDAPVSHLAKAPTMNEAPGGTATPFFIDQNQQANDERAGRALSDGGSALPTPVGKDVSDLLLEKNKQKSPLVEFREETERLKGELRREQEENAKKLQLIQQQLNAQDLSNKRNTMDNDDSLAQAMQQQLQQLMSSWTPKSGQFLSGAKELEAVQAPTATQQQAGVQQASVLVPQNQQQEIQKKILIQAGTVNYIQLLTEANSDVPGPILAQVLSGPLAGGRAIGRFEVKNDYLVMTFSTITLNNKNYSVEGLALDPDTTLGGMATEVDHRYLSRVVLPAAGAFISAFGSALADTDTTTTVSDGAVFVDQAAKGYKEALYSGIGSVGESVSSFFTEQANRVNVLVRVAVGTPMGLFFLSPVTDQEATFEKQVSTGAEAATIYQRKGSGAAGGLEGMLGGSMSQLNNMLSSMGGASGTTLPTSGTSK